MVLSDHQLIFWTRKIQRTRRNMHNQIQTRSLRNYSAENLIRTLKDIKFPNYDIFPILMLLMQILLRRFQMPLIMLHL